MSALACFATLLLSLKLLLDVLRGTLPAHVVGGCVCKRRQNSQVVLPARLDHTSSHNRSLRLPPIL